MIDTIVILLAKQIARAAFAGLGKKYSVDAQYILNSKIEDEIHSFLSVAIKAFTSFLIDNNQFSNPQQTVILEYLKSPTVSEEIWHLLDPGSEYFDRGRLTKDAHEKLSEHAVDLDEDILFDAWEEFLKAFSFASRSTPEFREFLRASYEAGSFKALANIEGVLEKMNTAINEVRNEESIARKSIKDYADELKTYRDWATSFQVS
jgi:hypothetical protein